MMVSLHSQRVGGCACPCTNSIHNKPKKNVLYVGGTREPLPCRSAAAEMAVLLFCTLRHVCWAMPCLVCSWMRCVSAAAQDRAQVFCSLHHGQERSFGGQEVLLTCDLCAD